MQTILVADDNSNIQKMVSLVFEEKGIRVVAVGNGEAACRKVPEVRPDIVLADVFMPVRNGYEVCEFVKQDPLSAGVPVVLLVGAFDPLDEKEAQRVGADGVLKKPFVPPDPLIAMVTSLLPKIKPPAAEPQHSAEGIPEERTKKETTSSVLPTVSHGATSEPEPIPEEFAFGIVPRDLDDAESAAPAFGEPVATPATRHDEPDDNYEEPASEWKRRRSTMEYDIPAAESASMVEKLASEHLAPELPSSADASAIAHEAFGGASIPEIIPPREAPAPIEENGEACAPQTEAASETASSSSNEQFHGLQPAEAEPSVYARHDVPEIEEVAPFPQISSELTSFGGDSAPEVASAAAEPVYAETVSMEQSVESVASAPDPAPIFDEKIHEQVRAEVAEEVFTKPQEMDAKAVDNVVAKLLEKLEPQIREAFSNGVLRPLVEEMLNRERGKK